MTEPGAQKRRVRKERAGKVISKSGKKSVIVVVERRERDPLYGKYLQRLKKYHVHDEDDSASVGDKVKIVECRPMSRLKRWRVTAVIDRSADRKA